MNRIGEGLGIGACRTVRDLRVRGFDIDKTREKNPLHPFLQKIKDMAMTHFDWKTGFGDNILHAFANQLFIRRIGENDSITQFSEKCPPKRKHLMKIENPGYPDLWSIVWKLLLSFIRSKKHLLSFCEEIRDVCSLCTLNDIILLTSASIKERFLSFHTHFSDEAEIGTTFALEGGLFIAALAQVKPFKTRTLPRPFLHD
jgi:hypothetical protein